MVSFNVDIRGLKGAVRMIKRVEKANKKLGEEFTRDLSKAMKRYAVNNLRSSGHVDTGRTLAAIRRTTTPNKSRVYIDTPEAEMVAGFLEGGVRPHKVNINAISFATGSSVGDWFLRKGKFPFSESVTVQITPTYFWSRAIRKTKLDAKRIVKKYESRIKG